MSSELSAPVNWGPRGAGGSATGAPRARPGVPLLKMRVWRALGESRHEFRVSAPVNWGPVGRRVRHGGAEGSARSAF